MLIPTDNPDVVSLPLLCIITPAIKYLKVVIPRLDRGIQKELDTPIKSEYDMFLLFNCLCNIYVS
jgi:hypothetical protein